MSSFRCAFVGLGFHLKFTKSTQFLIDFLGDSFGKVEVFADDWSWARLPGGRPWDLVVFFQHVPERRFLDGLNIRHSVLVPMYDDCSTEKAFWDDYRDCSILSFSSTLAGLLEGWGHRVYRIRYAPEVPGQGTDWSSGLQRAFFWPRNPRLGWSGVKALLAGFEWSRVHLHVTEERYFDRAAVSAEDRSSYGIHETNWFARPGDYREALRGCQAFVAPRLTEGIGMSFLEAMSLGMAVLAADGATMNEYIVHDVNGWLFDPERPSTPDWSRAEEWGREARKTIERVRGEYLASLPALAAFLRMPAPGPARRPVADSAFQKRHRAALLRYLLFQATWPLRKMKNLLENLR